MDITSHPVDDLKYKTRGPKDEIGRIRRRLGKIRKTRPGELVMLGHAVQLANQYFYDPDGIDALNGPVCAGDALADALVELCKLEYQVVEYFYNVVWDCPRNRHRAAGILMEVADEDHQLYQRCFDGWSDTGEEARIKSVYEHAAARMFMDNKGKAGELLRQIRQAAKSGHGTKRAVLRLAKTAYQQPSAYVMLLNESLYSPRKREQRAAQQTLQLLLQRDVKLAHWLIQRIAISSAFQRNGIAALLTESGIAGFVPNFRRCKSEIEFMCSIDRAALALERANPSIDFSSIPSVDVWGWTEAALARQAEEDAEARACFATHRDEVTHAQREPAQVDSCTNEESHVVGDG